MFLTASFQKVRVPLHVLQRALPKLSKEGPLWHAVMDPPHNPQKCGVAALEVIVQQFGLKKEGCGPDLRCVEGERESVSVKKA